MKKGLFAAFCLFSTVCLAQDPIPVPSKHEPGSSFPNRDMVLINLNFDGWINTPSTVQTTWFTSRGVDVALLYDYVIAKSTFSVALGVGFNSHNMHSNTLPVTFAVQQPQNPTIHSYTHLDASFFQNKEVTVNKLSTNFVDIPFEVRFRSKPHANGKRIAASVGFKIGWLVQSHTKTQTDQDLYFQGVNFRNKVKSYAIPNLTPFRYGVTARVGYANIYAQFFYSITSLFKSGSGTPATPISIGIGASFL